MYSIVWGYLGRDPEMKQTPSGRACCVFSVAEDLGKDKDGNDLTQWVTCRAYDRKAEIIFEHFAKGKPIWVAGDVQARLYDRNDGGKGLSIDMQVESFKFVPFGGKPARKEDEPREPQPLAQQGGGEPEAPDVMDPFADQ